MNKETTIKLFHAGRNLQAWRDAHNLTDDETREVLLALWPNIVRGLQQREAGKVTSERKRAASAANGRKGGRPRKTTV